MVGTAGNPFRQAASGWPGCAGKSAVYSADNHDWFKRERVFPDLFGIFETVTAII